MGHQIRFYLSNNDMHRLEIEISKVEPMLILHSRSLTSRPRVVESTSLIEDGVPWLFYYYVKKTSLDDVSTTEVPAQGYWSVDEFISPVIELSRRNFDGQSMNPGRLYYVDTYYDANGIRTNKSNDFCSWARDVFSRTRKLLNYDKELAAYVGEEANDLRNKGVNFTLF